MAVHLITGGAGFIAVNLTSRLLAAGDTVLAADDLSRGRQEFLKAFEDNPRFTFMKLNCSVYEGYVEPLKAFHAHTPITEVWHFAANSDIPAGVADPRIDLEQTFMTTFATLLVMRELKIPALHFASTSAVYGDLKDQAISELSGPPEPISNYGAMKLASEAQIRASVESHLDRSNIFRFPNVIGVPATHGVIFDFVHKLRASGNVLDVLGDGTQQKAYLHVDDLIDAMLFVRENAQGRFNIFNLGPPDDGITVREIAEAVRDLVASNAKIQFGVGNRGWVGDVPRFRYDIGKIKRLGWSPAMGSKDAIKKAVVQIVKQEVGE